MQFCLHKQFNLLTTQYAVGATRNSCPMRLSCTLNVVPNTHQISMRLSQIFRALSLSVPTVLIGVSFAHRRAQSSATQRLLAICWARNRRIAVVFTFRWLRSLGGAAARNLRRIAAAARRLGGAAARDLGRIAAGIPDAARSLGGAAARDL